MVERDASILDYKNYDLFRLCRGVFFVEGAKRAALYDTTSGNVYSLNQEAAQTVKGEDNDPEFWLKLISMRLAPNVPCNPNIGCDPFNCFPALRPCMPECAPAPPCTPTVGTCAPSIGGPCAPSMGPRR